MSKKKFIFITSIVSVLLLGQVAQARRSRKRKGRLKIKSVPRAKVFINGSPKGMTPLKVNAPPRVHTILLKAPGYKAMRFSVRVFSGRTAKVFKKLVRKRRPPRLSVHSNPSAKVFLDGRLIGRTPIVNRVTPKGPHRIRLQTKRGRIWKTKVRLRPNTPTRVNYKFPPLVRHGRIKVNSNPSAKVFLDGKLIGRTPLVRPRVRVGNHSITLKKPGFVPVSQTVKVLPGRASKVVKRLIRKKPRMGWLRINSKPKAKVFLDGKFVGWSPIPRLKALPGSHRLRFRSRNGRWAKKMRVRVSRGRGTRVNVKLQRRR